MNEINETKSEFNSEVESIKDTNEFMPEVSNTLPVSKVEYDEYNATAKPKKAATVITSLLSTAAILAIITTMLLPSVSVKADFISVSCTDTTIAYEIFVEDYSEDSEVSVVVYNDFVRFEASIDSQSVKGEFVGLKPNFRYTIAIMSGNKTIKKQSVYTQNSL